MSAVQRYLIHPLRRTIASTFNFVYLNIFLRLLAVLRTIWIKITSPFRRLLWAVVIPILLLMVIGMVTGIFIGLVLSQIGIVLGVFPAKSEKSSADSTTTIAHNKNANSATITAYNSPRHSDPPISPSNSSRILSTYKLNATPRKENKRHKARINNKSRAIQFHESDGAPDDTFGDYGQASLWESTDGNENDDIPEDLKRQPTVSRRPSQIEFYSQYRLTDDSNNTAFMDDTDDDGYQTPPYRRTPFRTPEHSRKPSLNLIREDSEVA